MELYLLYWATAIGKWEKAAAQHLTPVTLESAVKVLVSLMEAPRSRKMARRIVWEILNCGQTCIASDYLLVKASFKDALVQAIIEEIEAAFEKIHRSP